MSVYIKGSHEVLRLFTDDSQLLRNSNHILSTGERSHDATDEKKKSLYVVFCPTLGINCVCVNHDINSNSLKKTKCLVVCEITVYVVFCKVKWLVKAI